MRPKLSEDQIRKIYQLLQEKKKTAVLIAGEVGCSKPTVSAYRKRIEKLLGIELKRKTGREKKEARSLADILKVEQKEFTEIPPQPGYDERTREKPLKSFRSRDIGLVAALASHEHRVVSIKKIENNRGEFTFIDVPSLQDRKTMYYENQLHVDAHSYFVMVGKLKSKIFSMQDQVESFTD